MNTCEKCGRNFYGAEGLTVCGDCRRGVSCAPVEEKRAPVEEKRAPVKDRPFWRALVDTWRNRRG
jgi:hypothetical protein